MTFFGAISSAYRKYATFTGRASLSEFWWWMLFEFLTRGFLGFIYTMTMLALVVPLAGEALISNSGMPDPSQQAFMGAIFNPAYFVLLAWSLSILLPSLAVMVRRFHDTGRSGWFVLVTFIPLVGTILMIVLLVKPSAPDANEWGEPPTSGAATTAPASGSVTGGPVAGKK